MSNRGDDGLTPYERSHPRGRWHAEKDCPMSEQRASYDAAMLPVTSDTAERSGPLSTAATIAAPETPLTLMRHELHCLLWLASEAGLAEGNTALTALALAERLAALRAEGRS